MGRASDPHLLGKGLPLTFIAFHFAINHAEMATSQTLGFAGTVCDVQDGDASFLVNAFDELTHFFVQFLIQGAQRFVQA